MFNPSLHQNNWYTVAINEALNVLRIYRPFAEEGGYVDCLPLHFDYLS